jgi:hypothetical protein
MSTAPFPLIEDAGTGEQSAEMRAQQGGTTPPDDHRPRVGRLRRRLRGAARYRDALFERPDIVEDDYYRLANQPRGW